MKAMSLFHCLLTLLSFQERFTVTYFSKNWASRAFHEIRTNLLLLGCKCAHNKSPSANIRSTAAVLTCRFGGFITFPKVWLGAISSTVVNVTRSGSRSLGVCESGHACASLSCFCRRKWCVASRAAHYRTAAHQMTLEADWWMSRV